jgi:hypothetical protein
MSARHDETLDWACRHARSGAPPAAWQGPKFKGNLHRQTTLDQAPTTARFSLIVDD